MSANQTARFLGEPDAWAAATLRLDDVQALFGGWRVQVRGDGRTTVERVQPGGQVTRKTTVVETAVLTPLWQLVLTHDLVAISCPQRPGIPDEARPTLTLTNATGDSVTVAKWAGVVCPRFDAIQQALRLFCD